MHKLELTDDELKALTQWLSTGYLPPDLVVVKEKAFRLREAVARRATLRRFNASVPVHKTPFDPEEKLP